MGVGGGGKKVSKSRKEPSGACELREERKREKVFKTCNLFFRLSVKCT